jgi:hypothetical protein
MPTFASSQIIRQRTRSQARYHPYQTLLAGIIQHDIPHSQNPLHPLGRVCTCYAVSDLELMIQHQVSGSRMTARRSRIEIVAEVVVLRW